MLHLSCDGEVLPVDPYNNVNILKAHYVGGLPSVRLLDSSTTCAVTYERKSAFVRESWLSCLCIVFLVTYPGLDSWVESHILLNSLACMCKTFYEVRATQEYFQQSMLSRKNISVKSTST